MAIQNQILNQTVRKKNGSNKSSNINLQQLMKIIELAKWAPTPDNCQPFTFQWNGTSLNIISHLEFAEHAYNTNNIPTIISLGSLLEYIYQASLSEGYYANIEIPSTLNFGKSCAKIKFTNTFKKNHSLVKKLKERSTDRRSFKGGEISNVIEVAQKSNQYKEVKVNGYSLKDSSVIKSLTLMETTCFRWHKASKDLLKWLRLTKKEVKSTDSGLPYKNLGLPFKEILAIRFLRRFFFLSKLFAPLAIFNYGQQMKSCLRSSAGILNLSVESTDFKSLVKLGRTATSIWLDLNEQGYGVQPLSQSSLLPSSLKSNIATIDAPKNVLTALQKGWSELQKKSPSQESKLVWSFRVGLSDSLPESMRTKRRSLVDLLKVIE
ncbi:MAG: hypothetical protein KDD50_09150 [Bdellovibrionales bacterium]|nr:hypothetical protein [Bdellovibrionales bacterium]